MFIRGKVSKLKNPTGVFFRVVFFCLYLCVATFLCLEIIFRFLPTAQLFEREKVNEQNRLLRYKPNQEITYSLGTSFYSVVNKSTNNLGFVADYDYSLTPKPDIVLVGDSFVEALQVDFYKSVTGLLASQSNNKVFSFGFSGAALSQYLAYAQYAKEKFAPRTFVFVIVGNDFDESSCLIIRNPGHHCFDENQNNILNPYGEISFIKKFARWSAFIRYLVLNAHIDPRNFKFQLSFKKNDTPHKKNDTPQFVANTSSVVSEQRVNLSKEAVDLFLSKLKHIIDPKNAYFILDSNRQHLYSQKSPGSNKNYFETMRNYFILSAKNSGYNIVDMKPIFENHYRVYGLKFEFKSDNHWNELGHLLAAQSLLFKMGM